MPLDLNKEDITILLNADSAENPVAKNTLATVIYDELRRIAYSKLKRENQDCTVTVTSMVHEAFIRLDKVENIEWDNRRHFYGAAAETMRRILIERARYHSHKGREAKKHAVEFDEDLAIKNIDASEFEGLNDALETLMKESPELADIVKLRFFVGLTNSEIADIFECSTRTIERQWQVARAWLMAEIGNK